MQKYYLLQWPESQEFIGVEGCVQSENMSYFVPCELYENDPKDK